LGTIFRTVNLRVGDPHVPFFMCEFMNGEQEQRLSKALSCTPWWSSDNLTIRFFGSRYGSKDRADRGRERRRVAQQDRMLAQKALSIASNQHGSLLARMLFIMPFDRSKLATLGLTALLLGLVGACSGGEDDASGTGGSSASGGAENSGGAMSGGSGGAPAEGTGGAATGGANTGASSGVGGGSDGGGGTDGGGGSGGAEAHPWSCGPDKFWLAPCDGTNPFGSGGQLPANPSCQPIPERCLDDLTCECICGGWFTCNINASALDCGCA
jgi:hypothetical protein